MRGGGLNLELTVTYSGVPIPLNYSWCEASFSTTGSLDLHIKARFEGVHVAAVASHGYNPYGVPHATDNSYAANSHVIAVSP